MRLNELRDTSYEIAKSKGWHDPDFDTATFADRMALVISELAEALEEHRKGKPARNIEYVKDGAVGCTYAPAHSSGVTADLIKTTALKLVESGHKPEGIVIELADVLIRVGDAAGRHKIDLEISSSLVSVEGMVDDPAAWRGCHTFGEWFCCVAFEAAIASRTDPSRAKARAALFRTIRTTCGMARSLGITSEEFVRAIEIKHAYNRTRSFRHGGKKL